jgi:prepilin-type N-terminal cleavage/methylation domain-containing protein
MKDRSPRAFTLVEMIIVIAVVLILAGLVVIGSTAAQRNSSRTRAVSEMKSIGSFVSEYKQDNGAAPQTGDTDLLDPRVHFDPSGQDAVLYQKANIDLYKAITSDAALTGIPIPNPKSYYTFPAKQLSIQNGKVRCIQDPYGLCYGYSTAAAKAEAEYQAQVQADPSVPRPSQKQGYDPDFDLWSTAGGKTAVQGSKWVKKWGSY